jgi:hypothetical protein
MNSEMEECGINLRVRIARHDLMLARVAGFFIFMLFQLFGLYSLVLHSPPYVSLRFQ